MAGTHGASLWQTDGVTATVAIGGSPEVCTGARPFLAMAEADDALVARVQDPVVGIEPFLVRPLATVDTPDGPAPTVALSVGPNPMAGAGSVTVTLAESTELRVELFDVLGRRAGVLFEGALPAGSHVLLLEASRLAPGAYVVRSSSQGASVTARFVRRP
jgi:hypothetical protein